MNKPLGFSRILWTIVTLVSLSVPLTAQNVFDTMRFELVTEDLIDPLGIVNAGDGSGRLFLVEQGGRIRIHDGQQLLETPFLDISNRAVDNANERGLLGLVFHPDYEDNGYFFVNYTRSGGDTVIARYEVSSNPNLADPGSETVLLVQEQPFSNHNAGDLHFGPDGYLYFGLGDGGDAGDPGNRAQNLSTLLGKMIRIDVDSGSPYAIPPSNPFAGQQGVSQNTALPEIWAYGFRNPWRFSFDRETGDMLIGDVGQNSREEIDFQPASSDGGENYGWRRMEGTLCFNPPSNCNDGSLTLPILTYETGSNCSVTGGYRYRGQSYPQLDGIYFYADFCSGRIWAAVQQGSNWAVADTTDTFYNISTFGEDEAGELYIADHGGGAIYRLESNHPTPQLTSLEPTNAPAGSGPFSLMVRGSSFVPSAEVLWNGESRPTTFVSNEALEAQINAGDLAAQGTIEVTVRNPAPGGGSSAALNFTVDPGVTLMPTINEGGIVNAASFSAERGIAPGSIVSIFGQDLAAADQQADGVPLPTTLNGTTLRFNGSLAAPQFFQSPTQINVQVPWELEGQTEATIEAEMGGETSEAAAVALSPAAPGLFTITQTGSGQGAILISGTGLLAAEENAFAGIASRPVQHGEFLEIFATGLGPVSNPPETGAAAPTSRVSEALTLPTVTIGGEPATVLFAGLAPGFVGLYQVNVEVPESAPSGGAVELELQTGEAISNTVTIAVE